MSRAAIVRIALVGLAVVSSGTPLRAQTETLPGTQSRPDLSGTWVRVPDSRTPAGDVAIESLTIEQTAQTVQLDQPAIRFSGGVEAGRVTMRQAPVRSIDRYDVGGEVRTAIGTSARGTSRRERVNSAEWAGSQLVLVTHTDNMVQRGDGTWRTVTRWGDPVRKTLAIDADGLLTVESVVVIDPRLLATGLVETPQPRRSVYRRARD